MANVMRSYTRQAQLQDKEVWRGWGMEKGGGNVWAQGKLDN